MNRYVISQKATEDLEHIWQYTYFHWSENQADRYYRLLIETIEFIAKNAKCGKQIDDIKNGYRFFPAEFHIIFYKIEADGVIYIVRIIHQRMDIPSKLRE